MLADEWIERNFPEANNFSLSYGFSFKLQDLKAAQRQFDGKNSKDRTFACSLKQVLSKFRLVFGTNAIWIN